LKTDKPLLALLLSLTAGPILEGYTMLMKYLSLTNLTAFETFSFLSSNGEPHFTMGIIGLFTVVNWYFLLAYYSANIWGTAFFPIKTMFLAMTGESIFFLTFGVLGKNEVVAQTVIGNYIHASAAALAGLWVGFLYQKYLFKNWMGKSLKTDKPLLAMAIGWAGWPIAEGLTLLAKYFGLAKLTTMESSSLMWLLTNPSQVLGILSELGLGAWLGLIIYYSTNLWSSDYLPIKAALILVTCRSLIVQIFGVLGRNPLLIQDSVGETLVHALGAILGGLAIGYLMQKFLFKSAITTKGGEVNICSSYNLQLFYHCNNQSNYRSYQPMEV